VNEFERLESGRCVGPGDPCRLVRQVKEFVPLSAMGSRGKLIHLPDKLAGVLENVAVLF
jgi:hypothetical protein